MSRRFHHHLALAFVLVSSRAAAQAAPHVTIDLSYGGGGHSESAGATWYRGDPNVHPRLAVAALSAPWRHIAGVLSLEYIGQLGAGDATSDCPLAPNGTCRKYFPRLQGRGLTLGARTTTRALTIGLGFGRVGGFRWSAVDADGEVGGRHAGVFIAGRGAWRRGPDGRQIDFWPGNVGVRFKW